MGDGRRGLAAIALAGVLLGQPAGAAEEAVVNIYSTRHYGDEALFRAFTEKTGIEVRLLEGKHGQIVQRLVQEGEYTPADVLITVDASRLYDVARRGLLQPVNSPALRAGIPAHLRGPDGLWWGVAVRSRVIVYAGDRVDPQQVRTYADLADPRWRGRVLTRSGTHPYNISFVAWMIAKRGVEETERWCRGFVANFARDPKGGDTDQIRAVAAGVGDLALVNHYYFARLLASGDAAKRAIVEGLGVIFPDQDSGGAHVNVTAAAVTKHAPHPENALRFLEFLATPEAQAHFARVSFEFPANPAVEPHPVLRRWASVRLDTTGIAEYARYSRQALELMDRCGWK